MDGSSLIVAVMPITTLIALFAGIALPFIAASRSGRSHAGRRLACADALRRIGAAVRKARPPKLSANDAGPVEYLYVPCARIRDHGYPAETRRWVQEVPIVKKTAKWIYYTSDSWDRIEAVVSPGCISREQFETGTQCRADCPRDIAAGLVCAPHGRGHRHCVHVLAPGRHCSAPGGCGQDCPAGTRGVRCARHGYTWEHCPHGEDQCRHGYPAGVIPIPGARPGPGGPAILRHPPGRRRPPVPRGTRASRTGRIGGTTHQGAAPRHGRRPPRPRRHGRAVHPSAPPVPDGASARATVTCSPGRSPASTTALREEPTTVPGEGTAHRSPDGPCGRGRGRTQAAWSCRPGQPTAARPGALCVVGVSPA